MIDEERVKAVRFARTIASDIALYNEKKIIRSIENDTFFDDLKEEIDEGRGLYRSRMSPEIYAQTNYFDRAIVDVILKPKGHIRSKIW